MARIKGDLMILQIGSPATTLSHFKSVNLNLSRSIIEAPTQTDSGGTKKFTGLKNESVDFEASFDQADPAQDDLITAYDGGTEEDVTVLVGGDSWGGKVLVESLSITGSTDTEVQYSGTLAVDLKLTPTLA